MDGKLHSETASPDAPQDRFLRFAEVKHITGLGRTYIYEAGLAGTFPRCVALTDRAVAWRKSEIDAWMAERLAARDASAARATAAAPARSVPMPRAPATPTKREHAPANGRTTRPAVPRKSIPSRRIGA